MILKNNESKNEQKNRRFFSSENLLKIKVNEEMEGKKQHWESKIKV